MLTIQTLLILCALCAVNAKFLPPCYSDIYCFGPLLRTVQLARIFNDSKTFVDMKMKNNYTSIKTNFEKFMVATNHTPTKDQIKVFVLSNFEEGNELEHWIPTDYTESPKLISKIPDPVLKDFARYLVKSWRTLARKIKPEVLNNADKYSLIPVPNGFIVPGGRFREFYYWDTYWIIQGLLLSEMKDTARGMIDNFLHLVKRYGFVPNGGRIYYLNRSQPPLLTKMATSYYISTKNKIWLRNNIQYLEKELQYWLGNKTISIKQRGTVYRMAHYISASTEPRPESYLEDYRTAMFYPNKEDKDRLYMDLKSAAESGWDFSSRWLFDHKGGNMANLSQIEARRVIPVDLNSYLTEAFNSVSYLYSEIGDQNNTEYWQRMGAEWQQAIQDVLWNNKDGIWYDYDTKLSKHRKYFYPSNLAPLWAGTFDKHKGKMLGQSVLRYLQKEGVLDTPGGVGTSTSQTGEQWDFPNAWAPLQAIVVQALERSGDPEAAAEARNLAAKWLRANIKGYREAKTMYEKYDALKPGEHGGGGEYQVQAGFGWTNGVALTFINDYFSTNSSDVL